MNGIADEIDILFGFCSTWTQTADDGCWENSGIINIDNNEINEILTDTDDTNARALIERFIFGHEKGHHLQEIVWPHRDYGVEHHLMEIEADLIGAWVLVLQNQIIGARPMIDIVRRFDDANRIAQRLGVSLGDDNENNPHHPWAEQRELALVRGPQIAILYPCSLTAETHDVFADDIRLVARQIRARGL